MKKTHLLLIALAVGVYVLFKNGLLSGPALAGSSTAGTKKSGAAKPAVNAIAPVYQAIQKDPTNIDNYAALVKAGSGVITSAVDAYAKLFGTNKPSATVSKPAGAVKPISQTYQAPDYSKYLGLDPDTDEPVFEQESVDSEWESYFD